MKRSEINQAIRDAESFIAEHRFSLPPFAGWTPAQWKAKGRECDEIRDNMLGWDITDFGRGNFRECGLTLLTIRNGNQRKADTYPKPYAEKLLIVEEGQSCPYHFHWKKMEDLINRGGGVLLVQLYNSLPGSEEIDTKSDVHVHCDGEKKTFPAGHVLELKPGESITMTPGLYHELRAKTGTGRVLIGEVSQCNDDNSDNRFAAKVGRFPKIIEDVEPYRLLCNEYPPAANVSKL
ncbi:hypothetical protein NESM_000005300 [Novymonas esmeraldas]|uniref:D-lyxose ketol-isomerase n=1 Tax=Novymonas esmeraldas TaxID=1808958 RepID=A0AAW0F330_9TRYP